MIKVNLDLKIFIILCIFLSSDIVFAQLGFCQGNSGDPIFLETFGTGLQDSPLPAGLLPIPMLVEWLQTMAYTL